MGKTYNYRNTEDFEKRAKKHNKKKVKPSSKVSTKDTYEN
jgi:hypothetical protein